MPSMLSVTAFCADNGLSRSFFYRLLKDGLGPRLTKVLRRTLISSEAAAEWRARMERETEQVVPSKIAAEGRRRRVGQEAAVAGREAA